MKNNPLALIGLTFFFLLLIGSISGYADIHGKIIGRKIDDKVVTVQDQFGQIFYMPRTLFAKGITIAIGQPVSFHLPIQELSKIKRAAAD